MDGGPDDRETPIESLLDELAALRNLDRLRQAFPPDSDAHAVAAEQIERRSRDLMERFRALRDEPALPDEPPSRDEPPSGDEPTPAGRARLRPPRTGREREQQSRSRRPPRPRTPAARSTNVRRAFS